MKIEVSFEKTLKVSSDAAWQVLRDFGSIIHWVPGGDVGSIKLNGAGVGMTRDLELPSVYKVQHRLDELDESHHRIHYTLTQGQPIGMQEYSVFVFLENTEAGCVMHWKGKFLPADDTDPQLTTSNLHSAYENMTELFETFVGNRLQD